jgi:hypothetical protein
MGRFDCTLKCVLLSLPNNVSSFMKFCPVVPEICRGQVHGARKERRIIIRIRIRIIITIIRNGAKTISLPNFVWEIMIET